MLQDEGGHPATTHNLYRAEAASDPIVDRPKQHE